MITSVNIYTACMFLNLHVVTETLNIYTCKEYVCKTSYTHTVTIYGIW